MRLVSVGWEEARTFLGSPISLGLSSGVTRTRTEKTSSTDLRWRASSIYLVTGGALFTTNSTRAGLWFPEGGLIQFFFSFPGITFGSVPFLLFPGAISPHHLW